MFRQIPGCVGIIHVYFGFVKTPHQLLVIVYDILLHYFDQGELWVLFIFPEFLSILPSLYHLGVFHVSVSVLEVPESSEEGKNAKMSSPPSFV